MSAPLRLTVALGAVMALQSSLGLIFTEQYRDAGWIKAAWFGNDWVTLLAVPLFAGSIVFAARGSSRASIPRPSPVAVDRGLLWASLAPISIGLATAWLVMWAAYVFAGRATPIEPEAFKLVAALDLSMMATLLVAGSVLLWRCSAWGHIVAGIGAVQGSLYLLVLSVNSVVAINRGFAEAPGELPVWGTLAALTGIATVMLLRSVDGTKAVKFF